VSNSDGADRSSDGAQPTNGSVEARFRLANEEIRATAAALGFDDAAPFLCECADPACTKVMRLSLEDYDRVREHPTYFLFAAGHVEGVPDTLPVETLGSVLIVRKIGTAADHAEKTYPPRG
jgi:hypothetical protein